MPGGEGSVESYLSQMATRQPDLLRPECESVICLPTCRVLASCSLSTVIEQSTRSARRGNGVLEEGEGRHSPEHHPLQHNARLRRGSVGVCGHRCVYGTTCGLLPASSLQLVPPLSQTIKIAIVSGVASCLRGPCHLLCI